MMTKDDFRRAVLRAYAADPHVCRIADKFGLHHSTVKNWAAKAQIGSGNGAAPDGNGGGNGGNGRGISDAFPYEDFAALEFEREDYPDEFIPASPQSGFRTQAIDAGPVDPVTGLSPLIAEKARRAQSAYLDVILEPERMNKTAPKDAAAVYKTLAEVELKQLNRATAVELAARESCGGSNAGDAKVSPGLLVWERIWQRMIDAYDNAPDEDDDE